MKFSNSAPTYSVLTPTFNRAHTLRRVFESLQRQTEDGFEWCVVDDGSTDCSSELLSTLQYEARFPTRQIYSFLFARFCSVSEVVFPFVCGQGALVRRIFG